MMNTDYKDFVCCLKTATSEIKEEYFLLPIDGSTVPMYRERVYCYELYHQLRKVWGENSRFTINGEVDKSGHPLMKGPYISRVKPDLLIHTPGSMEGNFIVIEVKPINDNNTSIKTDLRKLSAFVTEGKYKHAIYLVYGGNENKINAFIRKILLITNRTGINLPDIELFWHSGPGCGANKLKHFNYVRDRF